MNSKLLKLNILLILLVLVSFVGCSDAEESKTEPWAPYTDDMTLKDYFLTDKRSGKTWHFRVPKAYFPSYFETQKLGTKRAKIHTGLPDLKPRKSLFKINAEPGTSKYNDELKMLQNGLFISIGGNQQTAFRINNVVNRMKNNGELIPSKYEGLLQVVEKDQCKRTSQSDSYTSYKCEDRGRKIFITSDKSPKTWRSYSCKTGNLRFGCRVNSTFKGMRVTYIFRNTEIDRLEEFEQAMQTILKRFYVDK